MSPGTRGQSCRHRFIGSVEPVRRRVDVWKNSPRWGRQAHGALVIVKKNALPHYLKPPVLIFGVLFPIFFFLAFNMGRTIPAENVIPGMVAMALWFTASAVGPLVTSCERRAKT